LAGVPGSSRAALPSPTSKPGADDSSLPSNRDRLQSEYNTVGAEDDDPLQLEHMLGYSGNYRRTALALPGRDNYYIKRLMSFLLLSVFTIRDLSHCVVAVCAH
jgi:hypothetical protein